MYREVLTALNWGIAETIYGEKNLSIMLYGICHYWIKKGLWKKSCRFLVIWVRVERSTERVTRTSRIRVYNTMQCGNLWKTCYAQLATDIKNTSDPDGDTGGEGEFFHMACRGVKESLI